MHWTFRSRNKTYSLFKEVKLGFLKRAPFAEGSRGQEAMWGLPERTSVVMREMGRWFGWEGRGRCGEKWIHAYQGRKISRSCWWTDNRGRGAEREGAVPSACSTSALHGYELENKRTKLKMEIKRWFGACHWSDLKCLNENINSSSKFQRRIQTRKIGVSHVT